MSSEPRSIWELLDESYFAVNRYLAGRLHQSGFTDLRVTHAKVFEQIFSGPMTVTEMAERAQMTKQAMGELVVYLEAAGYVRRDPHPFDRRAKSVSLTPHGEYATSVIWQELEQLREQLEARIGQNSVQEAHRVLGELVRIADG